MPRTRSSRVSGSNSVRRLTSSAESLFSASPIFCSSARLLGKTAIDTMGVKGAGTGSCSGSWPATAIPSP